MRYYALLGYYSGGFLTPSIIQLPNFSGVVAEVFLVRFKRLGWLVSGNCGLTGTIVSKANLRACLGFRVQDFGGLLSGSYLVPSVRDDGAHHWVILLGPKHFISQRLRVSFWRVKQRQEVSAVVSDPICYPQAC